MALKKILQKVFEEQNKQKSFRTYEKDLSSVKFFRAQTSISSKPFVS